MLLAQDIPAAAHDPAFQQWVIYLLLFLSLVGNVASKLRQITGKGDNVTISPQPIRTTKEPEFVTKREHSESLSGILRRLDAIEDGAKREYTSLTSQGHERMEKIRSLIDALKGDLLDKMDSIAQQAFARLNDHEARVARMEGAASRKHA